MRPRLIVLLALVLAAGGALGAGGVWFYSARSQPIAEAVAPVAVRDEARCAAVIVDASFNLKRLARANRLRGSRHPLARGIEEDVVAAEIGLGALESRWSAANCGGPMPLLDREAYTQPAILCAGMVAADGVIDAYESAARLCDIGQWRNLMPDGQCCEGGNYPMPANE